MVQIMKGTFIFSVAAFSVAIIIGTRLLLTASRKKNVTKRKPVPIIFLSGLLGSGKTSLLSQILRTTKNLKIGVVVNDFAEVNVDSRLIKDIDSSVALSSVTDVSSGSIGEAYLINFHDAYKTPWSLGCVCCSSVKDLSTALGKLMSANPLVDQIIVECSGLANPRNIAASIVANGNLPNGDVKLARLVTVVDAGTVISWLKLANGERKNNYSEGDARVASLSMEQVEFADLIVLNKVDRVSISEVAICRSTLTKLNPKAILQTAKFGVLLSGNSILFHEGETTIQVVENSPNNAGVTPGSTVRSFVYRRDVPFHPKKLADLIRNLRKELREEANLEGKLEGGNEKFWGGVLRSKGLVWVASSHEKSREWVYAGGIFELQRGSEWSNKGSHSKYGNRRQEIVFIGTETMSQLKISSSLDSCLLTNEELLGGPKEWENLKDPLILTLTVEERAQAALRPTGHSKACPCCDPDLKALDEIAFGGM